MQPQDGNKLPDDQQLPLGELNELSGTSPAQPIVDLPQVPVYEVQTVDSPGSTSATSIIPTIASTVKATDVEEKHRYLMVHLHNELRIKKLEIGASEDRIGELVREYDHTEKELHHIAQDIRRVEGELQQRETSAMKLEGKSKVAQLGIRDQDLDLKKRTDAASRLLQEIAKTRREIGEKEKRIAEIKEENRSVAKAKEELRHKSEFELANAKTKGVDVHNRQIVVQRKKQDLAKKHAEVLHKKHASVDRFHTSADNLREVARLETEERSIEQEIHHAENELHVIEAAEHKYENDARTHLGEVHVKELAQHKTSEEVVRLERDVARLNSSIEVKMKENAELNAEGQVFRKGKEELRRQYELEHFSANAEFTLAKEGGVQLERFKQEFARKEEKMSRNKKMQTELKQDLMLIEQDVATLEGDLRRGKQSPSDGKNSTP